MDFETEIEKLRDTLLVVTEIQRRQTKAQRLPVTDEDAIRRRFERIETSLAEAGKKIDALAAVLKGPDKRDRPEG